MKSVEELRIALKSGEYDGVDLMQSWCTMKNQQRQIAELTNALRELYGASYKYQCSADFSYDTKENCQVALMFEDALLQAGKLLEGN